MTTDKTQIEAAIKTVSGRIGILSAVCFAFACLAIGQDQGAPMLFHPAILWFVILMSFGFMIVGLVRRSELRKELAEHERVLEESRPPS